MPTVLIALNAAIEIKSATNAYSIAVAALRSARTRCNGKRISDIIPRLRPGDDATYLLMID